MLSKISEQYIEEVEKEKIRLSLEYAKEEAEALLRLVVFLFCFVVHLLGLIFFDWSTWRLDYVTHLVEISSSNHNHYNRLEDLKKRLRNESKIVTLIADNGSIHANALNDEFTHINFTTPNSNTPHSPTPSLNKNHRGNLNLISPDPINRNFTTPNPPNPSKPHPVTYIPTAGNPPPSVHNNEINKEIGNRKSSEKDLVNKQSTDIRNENKSELDKKQQIDKIQSKHRQNVPRQSDGFDPYYVSSDDEERDIYTARFVTKINGKKELNFDTDFSRDIDQSQNGVGGGDRGQGWGNYTTPNPIRSNSLAPGPIKLQSSTLNSTSPDPINRNFTTQGRGDRGQKWDGRSRKGEDQGQVGSLYDNTLRSVWDGLKRGKNESDSNYMNSNYNNINNNYNCDNNNISIDNNLKRSYNLINSFDKRNYNLHAKEIKMSNHLEILNKNALNHGKIFEKLIICWNIVSSEKLDANLNRNKEEFNCIFENVSIIRDNLRMEYGNDDERKVSEFTYMH